MHLQDLPWLQLFSALSLHRVSVKEKDAMSADFLCQSDRMYNYHKNTAHIGMSFFSEMVNCEVKLLSLDSTPSMSQGPRFNKNK